jgi:hypothetical protein
MLGNTVFEKNNMTVADKLVLPVNLSGQHDGIYFLTVKGKESTMTRKIVIRK